MEHEKYLMAIADNIAAEAIAMAMLLRARASHRGESLSRVDAINLALEAMAEEMEGSCNERK